MLVILKIGYQSFVLNSEQGLQTILKVLSKARVIDRDERYMDGGILTKGLAEVNCEILPPSWGWTKAKQEVLEPEVLAPHQKYQQPLLFPPLSGDSTRHRLNGPNRKQLPPPSRRQLTA
jgi:hypothetical protein